MEPQGYKEAHFSPPKACPVSLPRPFSLSSPFASAGATLDASLSLRRRSLLSARHLLCPVDASFLTQGRRAECSHQELFFLVPERILSPVDINDTFSNWAWHIPCSRMCHSVTHTWDGVQPPHTAPSSLPFSLNDLMSGTTVRVVFYMLHHSFTLQTGWLCT